MANYASQKLFWFEGTGMTGMLAVNQDLGSTFHDLEATLHMPKT